MISQKEQLEIIENLANKLWLIYTKGNSQYMQDAVAEKSLGKNFIETLEFFINQKYAVYNLEKDIDFPDCVKPDYFLHLMKWSEDFKARNIKIDKDLINIDLSLLVNEKRKLLRVFSAHLNQATVDKFEESFNSKNEYLKNYQTLVFKLAKRDLNFQDDLDWIAQVYFNNFNQDCVEILTSKLFHESITMDLKETGEKKNFKI